MFLLIAVGSFALYSKLLDQELEFVRRQVHERCRRNRCAAARAARPSASPRSRAWRRAGNRPAARPYRTVAQRRRQSRQRSFRGCARSSGSTPTITCAGSSRSPGNEGALGRDVLRATSRAGALRGAAERGAATAHAAAADLAQGYTGVHRLSTGAARGPVRRLHRRRVLGRTTSSTARSHASLSRDYAISINYDGKRVLRQQPRRQPASTRDLAIERTLRIGDQRLDAAHGAHAAISSNGRSPGCRCWCSAAGLLVAALAALSVRYVLISRLKSAHLAKSLALNAGIISSSAHLVIAIDAQYRIMIFNRAAEKALGYPAAGSRRAGAPFRSSWTRRNCWSARARCRRSSAKPSPLGPEIFTRIPLRDGSRRASGPSSARTARAFPINVIITPLRDEQGAISRIPRRHRGHDAARHEVDRMKSEFTAVVSHELRTPLTSIRGSLGLILGAHGRRACRRRCATCSRSRRATASGWCCSSTTSSTSRNSAPGRCASTSRPCALGDVVPPGGRGERGLCAQAQRAASSSPPSIRRGTSTVDPDRFVQVMTNLLSNAVKYSPPGGTVHVTAERAATPCASACATTGPGIPGELPRADLREDFRRPTPRPRARKAAPDSGCTSRGGSSSRCTAASASIPRPATARRSGWNCRQRRGPPNDYAEAIIGNRGLRRFPALPVRLLCGGAERAASNPVSPWPRWRAYVFAVAFTAAVLLLRMLAEPWMGDRPFLHHLRHPDRFSPPTWAACGPACSPPPLCGVTAKLLRVSAVLDALVRESARLRAVAVPAAARRAHQRAVRRAAAVARQDRRAQRRAPARHHRTQGARRLRVALAFLGAIGIVSYLSVVRARPRTPQLRRALAAGDVEHRRAGGDHDSKPNPRSAATSHAARSRSPPNTRAPSGRVEGLGAAAARRRRATMPEQLARVEPLAEADARAHEAQRRAHRTAPQRRARGRAAAARPDREPARRVACRRASATLAQEMKSREIALLNARETRRATQRHRHAGGHRRRQRARAHLRGARAVSPSAAISPAARAPRPSSTGSSTCPSTCSRSRAGDG